MFKKSLMSIALLFKYAPWLTIIKILQIGISALLAPMSIYFTQRIIDIAVGGDFRALAPWVMLLISAMFFSAVGGGFLNGILYIAIRSRLNIGMTPDIIGKFRRLDYACFEDRDVLDTLERMSDDPQDKVFQLFLTILGVIECAISVVCSALIYAQVGWWFAAGFAALLAPMIWLNFKVSDMMNAMMNEQSIDERRMHYLGGLLSGKSSLFELKVFRAADYILSRWRGIAHTVMDARVETTFRAQKFYLVSTVLFKAWSFFIVLSLVWAAVRGHITIGIFTALIASTGAVLNNADMLPHTMQNLRKRYLLMEHYYKFMSLPEARGGTQTLPDAPPNIVFEDVVFTYPGTDVRVLGGVSFEVRAGERAALVGGNGAGKSTIVKLLCRLYRPDSGRIRINGVDIQEMSAAALRRAFSVVFQDFCKYELTLRENVALSDITKLYDDAALEGALKMGLAGGIAPLDAPLGKIEEDGVDLSGGQWQRVAVARACLPGSAFVVLDEPTAALDPVAESDMYSGFASVLKNRGCIMISHRLASAKMADKIIVLSGGVVSETGSHAGLMAADGLYARMYERQSAWYAEGGAEV